MSPDSGISVVMAVRDAASTLKIAVSSLLAQTRVPEEILLVINGCHDESPQLARELAQSHPSLRLLDSCTSGGVAEAARVGCAAARFPHIARMDADDIAHPERLAHQWQTLQTTGADLVTCQVRPLHSIGKGLERFVAWANTLQKPEDFRRERFVESPVIQPGVLMKKACYQAAGGYRVQSGPEDYDLWLRMLEKGARFVQAPEALLDWRDSDHRLTRTHPDYSAFNMTATKAHYLARVKSVREHGVLLAGTGPIARRLCKLLLTEGIRIKGFFDVAPKKIGKTALGFPIWGPRDLGIIHPEAVLLACVGRGGRELVRKQAQHAGYQEGSNFFACC